MKEHNELMFRPYRYCILRTMGGVFHRKLVGQNARWFSLENLANKDLGRYQKVFEFDSFASLWWKMFVLKPENDQIWQKMVGHSTKLVGQTWQLIGQSPHRLYKKLQPCALLTHVSRGHWCSLADFWLRRWLQPIYFIVTLTPTQTHCRAIYNRVRYRDEWCGSRLLRSSDGRPVRQQTRRGHFTGRLPVDPLTTDTGAEKSKILIG